MGYRPLFPVLLQALLESIPSSSISNHLGKEFTAIHCMKIPLLLFQVWLQLLHLMGTGPCTGIDSSQSILFILSMILYPSIMDPLVFFFSSPDWRVTAYSIAPHWMQPCLLLAFSNSVYPEIRYQILLGFNWDLNCLGSLNLFENPFPSPRIGTWYSAHNMDIVTPKHMIRC